MEARLLFGVTIHTVASRLSPGLTLSTLPHTPRATSATANALSLETDASKARLSIYMSKPRRLCPLIQASNPDHFEMYLIVKDDEPAYP